MKEIKKKAFTLVELLIVIAILAVLSVVGLVGYSSFKKKAYISNDEALIEQINIGLKAAEQVDGKPGTTNKALVVINDYGFILQHLKPQTKDYHFAYNEISNQFLLLDENLDCVFGELDEEPEHNWILTTTKDFIKEDPEMTDVVKIDDEEVKYDTLKKSYTYDKGYSVYLYKDGGYETSNNVLYVTEPIGIDAGDFSGYTDIIYNLPNYEGSLTVRTWGLGDLTIDAPNATVHHWGTSDKVTINDIANDSYHEHAIVCQLDIKKGHGAIEEGAEIFNLSNGNEYLKDEDGNSIRSIEIDIDNKAIVHNNIGNGFITNDKEIRNTLVSECEIHDYAKILVSDHWYLVCTKCGHKVVCQNTDDGEGFYLKTEDNVEDAAMTLNTIKVNGETKITGVVFGINNEISIIETEDVVENDKGIITILSDYFDGKTIDWTVGTDKIGEIKDSSGNTHTLYRTEAINSIDEESKEDINKVIEEIVDKNTPGGNGGVAKCEHKYEAISSTATCTSGGTITYKCNKCNNQYTVSTGALGHNFKCTEDYQKHKCERCGKVEDHIQFNEATQRLYYNCPVCDAEFGTEVLPYRLHNAAEFEGFIKLHDWEGYQGYYQVYRENAEGYLKYLYVELANNIDCSTVNWPTGYSQVYYLNFEGKNHKLYNIDTTGYLFQTAKYYTCFYNVDFEDCNMKGFWKNNEYGAEAKDVNFKNCVFTESVFGNYLYYYACFDGLEFNNCSMPYFIKYPFYQTDGADYMNMKFYNCTIGNFLFYYAYDTLINMKDCVLDGCEETKGYALISYGGYSAYGVPTGFKFDNVDIKNSTSYGGAYIFYGGSGDLPITFKDCNVTNTGVYGGQGMAVGGFVGNASTSTVKFDNCSFDGEIISASETAAGFIGQASTTAGKISITNSYVSAQTRIVNKGGKSVTAFAGNVSNDFNKDGNRFLGTLSSTVGSLEASNGFEDINYVKYSTLATKDDFTFDETTGELKYIGDSEFDKITVREQVSIDNIGANLGGYSWVFDLQDTENVRTNTSLGNYIIVKSFKQVVDENYKGQIPFMTKEKSYLDETKKVAENGLYFSDGVLAIDSQIYNNGSQFIIGGLSNVNNIPTKRTIKLEILLYNGGEMVGSVSLNYDVNLK